MLATYTQIRWMIRRDMQSVLYIENESFQYPWSEEDFIRVLRQRDTIGMVAERDGQVAAFMIYELHKNPTALAESCGSSKVSANGNRFSNGGEALQQTLIRSPQPHYVRSARAELGGSPVS